jgi:choline kinase
MRAVIVAAGLGRRMKHMTRDLPKCMAVVLNGMTLLETQLATLRAAGVTEISVVRGHAAAKIAFPDLTYYFNDAYAHNNVLASLFYAEGELHGDVIVSYSDIWYDVDVVKRLCHATHDIAIAVDVDWKDAYACRKEHPIAEAETVIFGDDDRVLKLGKMSTDGADVHAEFIGMMKLTARGCEILRSHYHRARRLYDGHPFQRATVFQQATLADLLQEMADLGVPIHGQVIGSAWKEVDTIEDYEAALDAVGRRLTSR